MSISPARVKMLCNREESRLVRASAGPELRELSIAQLKQQIGRAQRLRDKWLDQSRAQRRKTQAAQRSRPTQANARSAEKAELFTAVLAKLNSRLSALENPAKAGRAAAAQGSRPAAAPKSAGKVKAVPTGKAFRPSKQAPPLVGMGMGNPLLPARGAQALNLSRRDQLSARASEKRNKFGTAGLVRVQKRTVAMNKRNQARRDARP